MLSGKKRKKVSRMRGSHTHSRGFKKKARGKGHRGGIGMAGSGKRADHKKTLITKMYGNKYFGKDKVVRKPKNIKLKTVTIAKIRDNLKSFIKKGIAKEAKGFYELNLKKYKIIGNSEINSKVIIHAAGASRGAQEAIKKSGGEIILSKKQ